MITINVDKPECNLTISKTIKGRPPRLPFLDMKTKILGKRYKLSLVFIGMKRSKTLNITYRDVDKPANILTFQLSKYEGEIYICLQQVSRDARHCGWDYSRFLRLVIIHGLLHLKGLKHGSIIKREEGRLLKQFGFW